MPGSGSDVLLPVFHNDEIGNRLGVIHVLSNPINLRRPLGIVCAKISHVLHLLTNRSRFRDTIGIGFSPS